MRFTGGGELIFPQGTAFSQDQCENSQQMPGGPFKRSFGLSGSRLNPVPAPDFSPGERVFKPARTLRHKSSGL